MKTIVTLLAFICSTAFAAEPVDLDNLDGTGQSAYFYSNSRGQVTGHYPNPANPDWEHTFFWDHGKFIDINPPGSAGSYPSGMNSSGAVVGYCFFPGSVPFSRSFIYQDGTWTFIADPNGILTTAHDINDRGQVVGASRPAVDREGDPNSPDAHAHAFLYENGLFRDLNTLLPLDSKWVLITGDTIDPTGHYITGQGIYDGSYWRNYMLTLP